MIILMAAVVGAIICVAAIFDSWNDFKMCLGQNEKKGYRDE